MKLIGEAGRISWRWVRKPCDISWWTTPKARAARSVEVIDGGYHSTKRWSFRSATRRIFWRSTKPSKTGNDQQIMNTFLGAAELSGRRREAYLRKTCATDQELRNEVDSLLIHHKSGTLIAVRQVPTTKSQSSRTRIQPNRNRRVMTLRIGR